MRRRRQLIPPPFAHTFDVHRSSTKAGCVAILISATLVFVLVSVYVLERNSNEPASILPLMMATPAAAPLVDYSALFAGAASDNNNDLNNVFKTANILGAHVANDNVMKLIAHVHVEEKSVHVMNVSVVQQ